MFSWQSVFLDISTQLSLGPLQTPYGQERVESTSLDLATLDRTSNSHLVRPALVMIINRQFTE